MNVKKSFWLWTRSFLKDRTQQVNLLGTQSSIKCCPACVPQGCVMSPMLFNVHVDDLENVMPNNLSINTCKYADDCTLDEIVALGSTSHMQKVLETSQKWAIHNRMRMNPDKTKDMWICFNSAIPTPALLTLDDAAIERVNSHKLLGVWQQENLKWNSHVEAVEESE